MSVTKALVFDCFGVLLTDGWTPFKYEQFGHDQRLFDTATELNRQSDAGLISYDDFIQSISELASMPSSQVVQAVGKNTVNTPLLDYIRKAKRGYKIGLLSNAASDVLHSDFPSDDAALFDATAYSYETGYLKPDFRAFQTIAERLGCEPSECLFIDDNESYCTAARESGMQSVWYRDFEQFKREMGAISQS